MEVQSCPARLFERGVVPRANGNVSRNGISALANSLESRVK